MQTLSKGVLTMEWARQRSDSGEWTVFLFKADAKWWCLKLDSRPPQWKALSCQTCHHKNIRISTLKYLFLDPSEKKRLLSLCTFALSCVSLWPKPFYKWISTLLSLCLFSLLLFLLFLHDTGFSVECAVPNFFGRFATSTVLCKCVIIKYNVVWGIPAISRQVEKCHRSLKPLRVLSSCCCTERVLIFTLLSSKLLSSTLWKLKVGFFKKQIQ